MNTDLGKTLIDPSVYMCIFSNQLIKKSEEQPKTRKSKHQVLASIIKGYNGLIKKEKKVKYEKNRNKQKERIVELSFDFLPLGHRSRSKAERASLLEEDDDDGDDAAEDSPPWRGNSSSLRVGVLCCHPGICNDNASP
jgi:hypothetical protein